MYGRLERGREGFREGVCYLVLNVPEMAQGQSCIATGCIRTTRQYMAANQLIQQPYALFSAVGLQRRIRQVGREVDGVAGKRGWCVGLRCEQRQQTHVQIDGEIPRGDAIRPEVKLGS